MTVRDNASSIRQRPIFPMPEALIEGAWVIRPSSEAHTMVDKVTKELFVPLGDSDQDFDLRTHELAHVKWSPDEPEEYEDVTPTALLASEDARIQFLLKRNGMEMSSTLRFTPAQLVATQSRIAGNKLEAASLLACTQYTGNAELFRSLTSSTLTETEQHQVIEALQEREHLADDFDAFTVDMARWLTKNFIGRERRRNDSQMCMGVGHGPAGAEAAAPRGDDGHGSGRVDAEQVRWGAMDIEAPPLVQGLPAHLRKRSKRASDTGVHLSRIHRLLTDERVFRVKGKKTDGGSVLIDVSGSMSLRTAQVKQIMEAMPSAIIAMYWGEETTGTLRIIAKNGKCVADEDMEPSGGGNIVDGPALEWLAKQQHPRIWVCDGVVTGEHDVCDADLDLEAEHIVESNRITRIESVQDALDMGPALLAL